MTNVETYYNHICNEWGVQPTSPTFTGYEHVEEQLKSYTKERWLVSNEEGRQQIEDEVFDIYRTVNIIPITYFSLEGCKQELKAIGQKSHNIVDDKIGVGATAGQNFSRFWFP